MAVAVSEVRRWLAECAGPMDLLAIDDGGLTLVVLDESDGHVESTFEIGGIPIYLDPDYEG